MLQIAALHALVSSSSHYVAALDGGCRLRAVFPAAWLCQRPRWDLCLAMPKNLNSFVTLVRMHGYAEDHEHGYAVDHAYGKPVHPQLLLRL